MQRDSVLGTDSVTPLTPYWNWPAPGETSRWVTAVPARSAICTPSLVTLIWVYVSGLVHCNVTCPEATAQLNAVGAAGATSAEQDESVLFRPEIVPRMV